MGVAGKTYFGKTAPIEGVKKICQAIILEKLKG